MVGLLFFGAASCVSVGSAVAPPTALERQLLGAYESLDDDLIAAGSVRGTEQSGPLPVDRLRALAIEARAMQRFNEDDRVELKHAGCLAEALDASLIERPCTLPGGGGPIARSRAIRVRDEENRARRDIVTWAAHVLAIEAGRSAATPAEILEIKRTYHRLLREAADGEIFEVAPGRFEEVGH